MTVKDKLIRFLSGSTKWYAVHEIPFEIVGANQCTVSSVLRKYARLFPPVFEGKWRIIDNVKAYKEWQLSPHKKAQIAVQNTNQLTFQKGGFKCTH